jgi:Holliday junction DNA helicase RuvA
LIAYIRGPLESKGPDYVIVEAAGLGYRVFVPGSIMQKLPLIGQEVKLHTYYHVREDAIMLYGFLTTEELTIFTQLISVSGIGPKVALSILGALPPQQFVRAIAHGELTALVQVPGVGKKTAQRLVLELKDKFPLGDTTSDVPAGIGAETVTSTEQEDAMAALLALGYTLQEAGRALQEARRSLPADAAVDQLIRQALRAVTTREGK